MVSPEILASLEGEGALSAEKLLERLRLGGLPSQEALFNEIEESLLLPKTRLPDHWLGTYQVHWDHALQIPDLLTLKPSPAPSSLTFQRVGLQGKVVGYVETVNPPPQSALHSTSMQRTPAPSKNFVRGKSGHVPFWPGGLEEALGDIDDEAVAIGKSYGLRTVPPGFTRGLRLLGEESDVDDLERMEDGDEGVTQLRLGPPGMLPSLAPLSGPDTEIDELLPASRANLLPQVSSRPTRTKINVKKRDWAHVVDVNKPMHNFKQLVPDMAHKYPFELDTFQKEAVYHLEMGDSVFVAAHTSAGKTVVAEYAIALAMKHMTRAIYTSPIKALSNQKFRDFKSTFPSTSPTSPTVGILTGDVQINPEAPCLIMTTEILRSMLYKGADLIRDVEFVIFDEVHYVNDAERGVVWEEVIIMLPDHVNIILLSATVPNTKEFADWVGRTKKKDIYVISTPKRPVPLEHYLYAGRDTHKIVDSKGQFLGQGYKDAVEALRRKQDKEREAAGLAPVQRLGRAAAPQRGQRGGGPNRGGGRGAPSPARGGGGPVRTGPAGGARTFHTADKNLYVHLLNHLKKKELLPVVVFTFSKKRCEEYAGTLTNFDLCTSGEKSEVHVLIERALGRLKPEDRALPQIARMRDLLGRGIGVHHGGLLPLVKEVVEILFARGLVKILFATETFAMGVNMPARCVVFSHIRKHDGRNFRDLLPGEYTQMSGRAGRRGLDSTGMVVIVSGDELPDTVTLNRMILGTPTKLQSQFRLTYNMILNLLRVEALRVEEMIKRSFSENASQRLLPDQQKKVVETEAALKALSKLECPTCEPDIKTYYDLNEDLVRRDQRIYTLAAGQPAGSKIYAGGRVVIVRDGHFPGNVAVLLKKAPFVTADSGVVDRTRMYFALALVDEGTKYGDNDRDPTTVTPLWRLSASKLASPSDTKMTYDVKAIPLSSIVLVTGRTIKIDIDMIIEKQRISFMNEAISLLRGILDEWTRREARIDENGEMPEVDWGRMRQLEFQEALRSREAIAKRLEGKSCALCEQFEQHYQLVHKEKMLLASIASLKLALSDQNLELLPDYEQRIGVLKELKFIDENQTVQLKGRVACEINSTSELILTELILENTLASYTPEEVTALLSSFVFQEKTDNEPKLTPTLEQGRDAIVAIAERVGRVQDRWNVADFSSGGGNRRGTEGGLNFGLCEVVWEWAKGTSFEEITKLTDVAEGTIVRVITRLDETCREVRDAARVIGDAGLFKKMEDAQARIKRDIVFAASLYF